VARATGCRTEVYRKSTNSATIWLVPPERRKKEWLIHYYTGEIKKMFPASTHTIKWLLINESLTRKIKILFHWSGTLTGNANSRNRKKETTKPEITFYYLICIPILSEKKRIKMGHKFNLRVVCRGNDDTERTV
jgi:hypothetical protein